MAVPLLESVDEEIFKSKQNLRKLGLNAESSVDEQKRALVWGVLASYLPEDVSSIEKFFIHHVEYTLAQTRTSVTGKGKPVWAFQALALSVRDRLIEHWKDTQIHFREKDCKRVAYLSMEFLLGRAMQNAILNLGLKENYAKAMFNLGMNLEEIFEVERDAGLGNGGLGRLAACFLDSLATLDLPGWGYGLRYNYGMFHQEIINGEQIECPDYWLQHGNPWEVERLDVVYPVKFFGNVVERHEQGKVILDWENAEEVLAVAYDTPIPGYNTFNILNIRLWSAKPSQEFDLKSFNTGDFYKSIEERQKAETITHVLYPNDNTPKGKELRLKQQYLFVSATLRDLFRRFKQQSFESKEDFKKFPDKVAIQLNDTHPALSIPEFMRLLVYEEGLDWEEAWDICIRTHAYTNHTVLPEALEKWPIDLLGNLLPVHLRIIYDINLRFLQQVEEKYPGDFDKLRRMSIIQEEPYRAIRMANLAIIGSHTVNGVAELHSKLLVETVFPDFNEYYPNKFQNKTNGVTPRRWIHQANPELSAYVTELLGSDKWLTNLAELDNLKQFADNKEVHKKWMEIKKANKQRLADFINNKFGIEVDTNALFDVQVKRIHEYKRQLLNIFSVIYRYRVIKHMSEEEKKTLVPRVVIFGGKAAPGYLMAKKIIKFINCVADIVNHDPAVGDLLKVFFLPNYRVSLAEVIIPASDISQHISTAGMEASGTSNMKFCMNGGLILGTYDGANIELEEEIGKENMFIFGALTAEIPELREKTQKEEIEIDPRFNQVIAMIQTGIFGQPDEHKEIISSVTNGNDYYILAYDFPAYLEAQYLVDESYKDQESWAKKSLLNTAGTGKFSSDRTILQYAQEIWGIEPVRRPGPVAIPFESLEKGKLLGSDNLSDTDLLIRQGSISIERGFNKEQAEQDNNNNNNNNE